VSRYGSNRPRRGVGRPRVRPVLDRGSVADLRLDGVMNDVEDARNAEAGASSVQREIERAERRRHRWRKNAVMTGVVGGAFVIALAASVLAGLGRSAASARGLAPAKSAPKAGVAIEPIVTPGTEPGPSGAALAQGQGESATDAAPGVDAPAPAAQSKPEPRPKAEPGPDPKPAPKAEPKKASSAAQHFNIRIGGVGYEPSLVTASAGRPITLTVGKGEGCAAGFLMPSLGVEKDNSSGAVTIKLGRLKPGTYGFSCGMGMVQGRLVVR
jgi:hypothetical protein